MSYTLNDMASADAQNAAVQLCWGLSDDGVLVVIEKATPDGFGVISRVRDAAIADDGDRQQKDHTGTMRQNKSALCCLAQTLFNALRTWRSVL